MRLELQRDVPGSCLKDQRASRRGRRPAIVPFGNRPDEEADREAVDDGADLRAGQAAGSRMPGCPSGCRVSFRVAAITDLLTKELKNWRTCSTWPGTRSEDDHLYDQRRSSSSGVL